jgi:hypothetical protein
MTIEQAVMIDRLSEKLTAQELANYLVNNNNKYADELEFNLRVEIENYIEEHQGQTYIDFDKE